MAQDRGSLSLTYIDHNSEKSSVVVNTDDFDFGVVDFATTEGLLDTLKAAIGAVTDGVLVNESRSYLNTVTGAVPPVSDAVQRERKFLVIGHDNTTFKPVRMEIPCAKTGITTLPSTPGANEYLDLTGDPGDPGRDLKDALEAVWKAGDDYSHSVTVDRIELVHRRS